MGIIKYKNSIYQNTITKILLDKILFQFSIKFDLIFFLFIHFLNDGVRGPETGHFYLIFEYVGF